MVPKQLGCRGEVGGPDPVTDVELGFCFSRRDEVNKAYRRLAVLLHPDKCVAPGSEDAFKAVVSARTALLKNIK